MGRCSVFRDVGEEHTWPALVGIHYEGLVISQDHRYQCPICPSDVVAHVFEIDISIYHEGLGTSWFQHQLTII